ncbi:GNAT family N-acetyltransferase [Sphingomonas sp. MMS24-J13]|uniref:GNAT family N-acetyltransferase n=1 Tax=Sphingomonas sp. MMS24-J13 TaxID=3238686 RepID=UPI00385105AB
MSEQSRAFVTHTGLRIIVRPAEPEDGAILDTLFHHVAPEDLRFRFLTGLNEVRPAQIDAMIHVDPKTAESFIAFREDGKTPLATAMLACDPAGARGEVAISVHSEFKKQGIGWQLLSFMADEAKRRGVKVIEFDRKP